MDTDKRTEWQELLVKGAGVIDPDVFIKNARHESSAFHDDFTWVPKEQQKQYLEKRAASLIRAYSVQFNVESARQRLYGVPKQPESPKKVYKRASVIKRNKQDRDYVRADVWKRLRTMLNFLESFQDIDPEFAEMYEYLEPKVRAASVVWKK